MIAPIFSPNRRMEDHELPIFFESRFKALPNHRFGKIISIQFRTRCTRRYTIKWANGEVTYYKGARSRPSWIAHIYLTEKKWLLKQERAKHEKPSGNNPFKENLTLKPPKECVMDGKASSELL